MKTIEYRVRPVTRYIVTRFQSDQDMNSGSSGSECCGEFDREDMAEKVSAALADKERRALYFIGPHPGAVTLNGQILDIPPRPVLNVGPISD